MNKREEIYNKYGGKCAYCGCEITIKNMHIDHLIPIYRNDTDEQLAKMNIIRGTDDYNNLMPSCSSCNLYKSTLTIEKFRSELTKLNSRLNKYTAIYRISKRYGLITENDIDIIFHFEKNIN